MCMAGRTELGGGERFPDAVVGRWYRALLAVRSCDSVGEGREVDGLLW